MTDATGMGESDDYQDINNVGYEAGRVYAPNGMVLLPIELVQEFKKHLPDKLKGDLKEWLRSV